jgi:hypothetical protein
MVRRWWRSGWGGERTSPASRCSVTFDFGGGPAPAQFRGDADFDADGEPVDVDATFTLR